MLHALLTFAAEAAGHGEEVSKTPFYVAGAALAVWGVVLFAVGMTRHADWPGGASGRGIMGLSALLVLATMVTSVITG